MVHEKPLHGNHLEPSSPGIITKPIQRSLRALKEKDYQRYIPKPYMNYFKSVQFYSDRDEKIQPKGVTADYRGYAKA